MNSSDHRAFELHAETTQHKNKISDAIQIIKQEKDNSPYIAFSGGKDSTVLLHLVRETLGKIPAYHYDFGEFMPRPMMQEIINLCPDVQILQRWKNFYADFFGVHQHRLAKQYDVAFIGIRSAESGKRRRRIAQKQSLGVIREAWPLHHWSADDIWAYITSHHLQYHSHYDIYAQTTNIRDVRFSTYFDPEMHKIGAQHSDAFHNWRYKYHK